MRHVPGSIFRVRGSLPGRSFTPYPLSDTSEPNPERRFAMFGRFAVECGLRRDLCRDYQRNRSPKLISQPCRSPRVRDRRPIGRTLVSEFRSGFQIYTSVRNYLLWRSGADWRPMSHRFHDDRLDYLSASNTLNQAFNSDSPKPCACPYCSGSPFADERRPVQPVASDSRTSPVRRARA